jgi:hypothetical protein
MTLAIMDGTPVMMEKTPKMEVLLSFLQDFHKIQDAFNYLMGENRVEELTLSHFSELGFLQPATSYTSIKGQHRTLIQNYTVQSQYGLSNGLKNVRLLSTSAPFKQLESIKPAAVTSWYKNLV